MVAFRVPFSGACVFLSGIFWLSGLRCFGFGALCSEFVVKGMISGRTTPFGVSGVFRKP